MEHEYMAIDPHRSEYPEPASFSKGTSIIIGRKYQGPENWDDWYFCVAPDLTDQPGGWVPGQIIERTDENVGKVLEDYTARELDVNKGDMLIGSRIVNGWLWCTRPSDGESGWAPITLLQKTDDI
jgi:hypothetical protein